MDLPSSVDLQRLIRTLAADASTPVAIRNECHHLVLAIYANDETLILDSLSRLQQIAEAEGFSLPSVSPDRA